MKEKVVYSFESIILQLLIITQSYQLKVVSWWCVYQFDLRWLCIYQCLHLTVCVSIWPQFICISVSQFDSVCIKLTSVDCVYTSISPFDLSWLCVSIWWCVYQTDLSWMWKHISVSPFDSVCITLTSVDCVYTLYISVSIWQCARP